jgi:hypothetical protein
MERHFTRVLAVSGVAAFAGTGCDLSQFQADAGPEVAGITVTPTTGLTTTEAGGTATFTIKLNTKPTAEVTIGLSSSNVNEGTVNPSGVTFTSENWGSPQTVTVTGANDTVVDGDQVYTIITAPAVSADPRYHGLDAPDVSVANVDTDTPSVFVFTGAEQAYVVPAGVIQVRVKMWGAGGSSGQGCPGGGGGYSDGYLAVTPGEVLSVLVGGAGSPNVGGTGGAGGFGGGGRGGDGVGMYGWGTGCGGGGYGGGGGGGASGNYPSGPGAGGGGRTIGGGVTLTGSGQVPANAGDPDRGPAGNPKVLPGDPPEGRIGR